MKTNIYLSIAAISALALVSCNKLDTPTYEPVIYTLQDAKINLGFTNNQGPIRCIELHNDGSYVAEVSLPVAKYEGLHDVLQLPFASILAGITDTHCADYISGTYTPTDGGYSLSDFGTLSFDDNMMFANYTYQGNSYRDRTGITPLEKFQTFTAAEGKWAPAKTDVKVVNLVDDMEYSNTYSSFDLEKISVDVASGCAPELAKYLDDFKGYSLNSFYVTEFNTFMGKYANGKTMGGYWNFKNKSVSYSKDLISFTANLIPTVSAGNLSIEMYISVIVDKVESYQITARVVMN